MRIRFGTVVGIVAAVILAAGISAWAEEKTMTPLDIPMIGDMEALKIGDSAPAFELKDVNGKPYSFVGAGKGAKLLVFWSIFCEPCRAEMPLIQSLYDRHKAKGFDVIAVALDGDLAENIKQFVKQGKHTFTVLLDQQTPDGALIVAEKYMVPGTPTLYLVDPSGKITFVKVGRTGEEEFEKAILGALGK